jgi:CrcB protein
MQYAGYIFVGIGGALGAIIRVAIAKLLPDTLLGMPTYILGVNIIGCFVMGLVAELSALHWTVSENMHYFLMSGLLGGFTTFSAFALEFALLYEKKLYFLALTYGLLSFLLSITGFFAGLKLVRFFS